MPVVSTARLTTTEAIHRSPANMSLPSHPLPVGGNSGGYGR